MLANPKTIVNDKWAKEKVKAQVIRADQLIETIKRMNKESKEFSSTPKELLQAGNRYLEMNQENPADYLKKFQDMVREMEESEKEKLAEGLEKEQNVQTSFVGNGQENAVKTDAEPEEKEYSEKTPTKIPAKMSEERLCPRCGMKMVLREAKRGNHIGEKFYGCAGFPKCRYTEKFEGEEE